MSKSFILIDNGLLRDIYEKNNGDKIFSELYTCSLESKLPDIQKQEAIVTPFSLLEAIGFGEIPSVVSIEPLSNEMKNAAEFAKKYEALKKANKKYDKAILKGLRPKITKEEYDNNCAELKDLGKKISTLLEAIRTDLFKKYKNYFSTHDALKPETLLSKFNGQYERLSNAGKAAFDNFFRSHVGKQSDTDYIAQFLAFDAIYKFDWPGELLVFRDAHVFGDMIHALKDDISVMQTRGFKYVWINASRIFLQKEEWTRFKMSEEEFEAELNTGIEALDIKTREDLLDTEILQFLVTGKRLESKFEPIYVYTKEENIDKFIKRIAVMKTLANFVEVTANEYSINLPSFSAGTIIFVGKNHKIEKIIDVKDVTPLLIDRE